MFLWKLPDVGKKLTFQILLEYKALPSTLLITSRVWKDHIYLTLYAFQKQYFRDIRFGPTKEVWIL